MEDQVCSTAGDETPLGSVVTHTLSSAIPIISAAITTNNEAIPSLDDGTRAVNSHSRGGGGEEPLQQQFDTVKVVSSNGASSSGLMCVVGQDGQTLILSDAEGRENIISGVTPDILQQVKFNISDNHVTFQYRRV